MPVFEQYFMHSLLDFLDDMRFIKAILRANSHDAGYLMAFV